MIDSRYSNSRMQKIVIRITKKYLVSHVSANFLTGLGLIFGLLSSLCIGIHGFGHIDSGFQDFLQQLWFILIDSGFSKMWVMLWDRGLFAWKWQWGDTLLLLGAIFMIFSFTADIFDGTLARITKPTKFGGIFDIFADRLVELSILLGIISISPQNLLWPGVFVFTSIIACITIFLLIGGAVNQQDIQQFSKHQKVLFYTPGLMERTETFLFLWTMVSFSPFRVFLMWIFGILVWFTAFQRFYYAYLLFTDQPAKQNEKKHFKENTLKT